MQQWSLTSVWTGHISSGSVWTGRLWLEATILYNTGLDLTYLSYFCLSSRHNGCIRTQVFVYFLANISSLEICLTLVALRNTHQISGSMNITSVLRKSGISSVLYHFPDLPDKVNSAVACLYWPPSCPDPHPYSLPREITCSTLRKVHSPLPVSSFILVLARCAPLFLRLPHIARRRP